MGGFVLNVFVYNLSTSYLAQGEGEWRKTVEQGAEHLMAKGAAAEKVGAGLRHAVVVCLNVTEKNKYKIAQNKRVRAGSLAIVD